MGDCKVDDVCGYTSDKRDKVLSTLCVMFVH